MKTIGFYEFSLGERGTTVAVFDYAYYNQTILGNKSIIIYNKDEHDPSNSDVLEKFKKHFEVYGINTLKELDDVLLKHNADICYIIKSGHIDDILSSVAKNCIHCVFNCQEPHGDVYAGISPLLPGQNYPVVPHMINLPDHNRNMRQELGIPENALVYGRHGGYEQFNIGYVHKIVYNVAKHNPEIYFLFVNTRPFCDPLPNIIHLPKIIDLDKKVEFINTCDAMLWASFEGETFGLAIGEFSVKNKPVICTNKDILFGGFVDILRDKAIWYDKDNLEFLLTSIIREELPKYDWNAHKEYTPENVMKIFDEVFIQSK